MQMIEGRPVYSASDLNDFLACTYLGSLERLAAAGEIERPEASESAQLIAGKGDLHERILLAKFRERYGDGVVMLEPRPERSIAALAASEAESVAAMAAGAEIIYQPTFFDGTFLGRADFLRKIFVPSDRWPWSYEVLDAKLARTARPYFLVQLCNYAEHVARVQGTAPVHGSILPGSGIEQRFTLDEYAAYYRHAKQAFLERAATGANESYPHEVTHCRICRWNPLCERRRDDDDYLGLVAGMRRDAIARFESRGITTIAALAAASGPQRPERMAKESFEKLRAQAALQHVQRTTGRYEYELLPLEQHRGLSLLPPPDAGDVFFDMEGDPLYTAEHGLEYLFGFYLRSEDRYHAFWATEGAGERRAFEAFMDFLIERLRAYPSMHVYHYAPYETSALKRLAGRYGSREEELDTLLRAQTFVDLYAVVRTGMRVSQPSYSIKQLEPFYRFRRETRTQHGEDSIVMFESWLATRDDGILADIEAYNRDDCISTLRLRDWLIELREELAQRDGPFPWKSAPEPLPAAEQSDERSVLRDALLAQIPAPQTLAELRASDEDFRARWLLGHLLDYHRREEKPAWWSYFYRCENRDELVEFDTEALGELRHRADIPPYRLKRSFVHVYEFPEQQHQFVPGDDAYVLDAQAPRIAGTIVDIDSDARLVHLKVSSKVRAEAIDALAPVPAIRSTPLRDSLMRVARRWVDGTLEREHHALYDLLLARPPRADLRAASLGKVALSLDGSYLFVQGPPGSGKSSKGAEMILDLHGAGKRVAIMANAHKAIHNLLDKIEETALKRGARFRGIQRYNGANDHSRYVSRHTTTFVVPESSNEALDAPHDLAAGTAWIFAREELTGRYDYLVIDEAGQVSLANALACAPCARNVILLGDPLQLAQVSQGAHPAGVALSVLEHLLGDAPTVPPDRGIFLDQSFRMHPEICRFISDAVYGGRLQHAPETAAHRVESPGLRGSGLRFFPVAHQGNSKASEEEAAEIVRSVELLLQGRYELDAGAAQPIAEHDVLVVSPYNAQRRLLRERLVAAGLANVRVGTVDSFQGLQAPVVFYSMATSNGEEIPRGVGFLFERNRLNVAISRAQCLSVLVCSPDLLDVVCQTPQQMALVNLLCSFAERAQTQSVRGLVRK
jgi:predicted RecB family nuclease